MFTKIIKNFDIFHTNISDFEKTFTFRWSHKLKNYVQFTLSLVFFEVWAPNFEINFNDVHLKNYWELWGDKDAIKSSWDIFQTNLCVAKLLVNYQQQKIHKFTKILISQNQMRA